MATKSSQGVDVLLLQPPIRDFYLTAKRTIPYGLVSIAASLIQNGFTVDVFDALGTSKKRPEPPPQELSYLTEYYGKPDCSPFCLFHQFQYFGYHFEYIARVVKESNARIVGISSLFTAYSKEALEVAYIVKKSLPECSLVMGGHHPTVMPEKVMECEQVDFLLRGEGESAFPVFVRTLKKKGNLQKVPGIVFRKHDGSLFINPPAIVDDPGQFPIPAMHMVKSAYYQRDKKTTMVVVSSRGCPMKCTYCCLADSPITYRRRKVSSVLDEIDIAFKNHNTGLIDFEDENISLDRKWFQYLLEEIIKRYGEKKLELRAMNGLFPPSLDEYTIKLMKKAGFKTLNLSVGSMSPEQLKKFNRPEMVESLEKVLSYAKKYGLNSVCYLIAGAPGQKADDSLSDLIYLAKKPVVIGLSIFYPAPGSTDYKYLEKKGLLPEHISMLRSSAIPVSDTTSRIESITLLRLARIINFMKLVINKGDKIPDPAECGNIKMLNISDRMMMGRQLLSWFLFDGRIRGITPQGEIFIHNISTTLTRRFIAKICDIKLIQ
ncbi:MAG: B12-binding domain-containing radical SAM protein [Desulfobacterales bacterium]|nr:B12-binding domain-containing radical SAM protein [Desulfobacterales bacterium]